MDEVDILRAYQEAHTLAVKLGFTLTIENKLFVLQRDGEEIYAKIRINGMIDFLRGYECRHISQ